MKAGIVSLRGISFLKTPAVPPTKMEAPKLRIYRALSQLTLPSTHISIFDTV